MNRILFFIFVLCLSFFVGASENERESADKMCTAVLQKFVKEYPWHEEMPEGSFSDGIAPFAEFKALDTSLCGERVFGVLFLSNKYEALLETLSEEVGSKFEMELPVDFINGKFNTLHAYYVKELAKIDP